MDAIFQKKGKKAAKKGEIFENLGKMYKIWKYFEKEQPHAATIKSLKQLEYALINCIKCLADKQTTHTGTDHKLYC